MPRGGSRKHPADCKCGNCPKIGRSKLKPEVGVIGDKNFATGVFARVGKAGWLEYVDIKKVASIEDYALHILANGGLRGDVHFEKLLDRMLGKPVQTVNHLHDKPIEMNVNLSIAEIVRKVRQRKQEYERSRS
jgi:hypothetical protein